VTAQSDWHIQLRRTLASSFTRSELEWLANALPIDFANLPGGRSEKIAALIAAYSRAGLAPELIERCGELHPEMRWEALWNAAISNPFAVEDTPDPGEVQIPGDPTEEWADTVEPPALPLSQDPAARRRWMWAILVLSLVMGSQAFLGDPAGTPQPWQDTGFAGAAPADVPVPLDPPDGTTFRTEPGPTTVRWSDVDIEGFGSYAVEVDCLGCCREGQWCTDVGETYLVDRLVEDTTWTFGWFSTQPGRWRVWAVSTNGVDYPKSAWSEFRYEP
jgi:hypothetical protein